MQISYLTICILCLSLVFPLPAWASEGLEDPAAGTVTGEVAAAVTRPVTTQVTLGDDLRNIYLAPVTLNTNEAPTIIAIGGLLLLADDEIFRKVNEDWASPGITELSSQIGWLGNGVIDLGICGLIGIKDPKTAYLGANAIVYAGIITQILKITLGRARPYAGEGDPGSSLRFAGPTLKSGYDSMPSGHAATAFALATVLADRYPKYKTAFYMMATLVAISRVYEGVHWPSDVFFGAAIGVWSANSVMGRSRLFEVKW